MWADKSGERRLRAKIRQTPGRKDFSWPRKRCPMEAPSPSLTDLPRNSNPIASRAHAAFYKTEEESIPCIA